ncbi:MAG: serine hydrolase [Bacteroidales bacterium]
MTPALLFVLAAFAVPHTQAPARTPVRGASALEQAVTRLMTGFQGRVFVYAKNLDTGAEFAMAADDRVRTASTIKLPILCALSARVAAGRMKWDDRITLHDADKISGSGVLTELSDGTVLTLRDLSNLMIVVSDNTATNLVLDRLTADAVNDYLDTIGLRQTRSNRKIRGDGTALKPAEGWSKAGSVEENGRFGIGVSTPREMVRLLEMLERGTVVSARVSNEIIATLKRQQYKDGIGRHAGDIEVASKSGALDHLRSDVGIAYAKGGRIAMAITVDDMPKIDYSPDNVGNLLIADIALALIDGLAPVR